MGGDPKPVAPLDGSPARFSLDDVGVFYDTRTNRSHSARELFDSTSSEFDINITQDFMRLRLVVILEFGPVECAKALYHWWQNHGKPYQPRDAASSIFHTLGHVSRLGDVEIRWLLQYARDHRDLIAEVLESGG